MTSKFNIDNRELLQRISCGEAVTGIDFGNLIVRELAAFRLAAMDQKPAIHRYRRKSVEPYGPYPWHYEEFVDLSQPLEGIEDEYYYAAPPAVSGFAVDGAPAENHIGSKNALDAIVSFIKSKSNPTVKCYEGVSEQLFKDNCHGIHSHVIEYILKLGEELEDLRAEQDEAQPAPVVPDELNTRTANDVMNEHLSWKDYGDAEVFCIAWNACRTAMLRDVILTNEGTKQAGSSPAIPDGWIPVGERLPEVKRGFLDTTVIIAMLGEKEGGEALYCSDGKFRWGRDEDPIEDVTHWMPLPAAPQEVK